jgi:hypothetical protein
MNLHILILILLNGHKISCPQQQLDTEALSQSETFCEEYSVFKTVAFESAVEDFKETGDEIFAWESFEKKLSAYSFLKYLVQENDRSRLSESTLQYST